MIRITSSIAIHEDDVELHFVRSSGPGGQNVNKVATAVQLRFDAAGSQGLPEDVRTRLIHIAGRRMTEEGVLVIDARRFRSQERNREDAMDRLAALIRKAAERPRPRKKTRPTPASRQKRLDAKRRRAVIKRTRRPVSPSDS